MKEYKKEKGEILDIFRYQHFESGYNSLADNYVKNFMEKYGEESFWVWFLSIYNENKNWRYISISILQVLSHMEYDRVGIFGEILLNEIYKHNNNDLEVKDLIIRTCENWGAESCLCILHQIACDQKWLEEYRLNVIKDLEEQI